MRRKIVKTSKFHLYNINCLEYVIDTTSVFFEEESRLSCIRYFKFLLYNMICVYTKITLEDLMLGSDTILSKSNFIFIIVQRDATQSSLFIILQVRSTCFGCQPHPSSGVHITVTTASGTVELPPSNVAKQYRRL